MYIQLFYNMDSLSYDLQELIVDKIDSNTLYNMLRNGQNTKNLQNYLDKRTRHIISNLQSPLLNKKNIQINMPKISNEFIDHMQIFYNTINLVSNYDNNNKLVINGIQHLLARYPPPENYNTIETDAREYIDLMMNYEYIENNDIEYISRFYNTRFKHISDYINFDQQFYLLCTIIIEFYKLDYNQYMEQYDIQENSFDYDFANIINKLVYVMKDSKMKILLNQIILIIKANNITIENDEIDIRLSFIPWTFPSTLPELHINFNIPNNIITELPAFLPQLALTFNNLQILNVDIN